MIKINLIPIETVKKRSQGDIIIIGSLVGGLIFFAFAGSFIYRIKRKNDFERDIVEAKKELKKYQNIVNQVDALKREKTALEQRRNVIKTLLSGKLVYPKFMDSLISGLPSEIWITSCDTSNKGSNMLSVQIQAVSFSNFAIADWITALETSKEFSNVELGSITASEQVKKNRKQLILNFSLKFNFRLI